MSPLRSFYVGASIMLLVLVYFLYQLSGILLPFVIGFAVAYFLDPVADRLEALGVRRTLATALIAVAMMVVLLGFLIFGLPILFAQIGQIIVALPGYITELQLWIEQQGALGGQQELVQQLGQSAVGSLQNMTSQILLSGLSALNVFGLLLISPIVAIYMLNDWDRMMAGIDHLLPDDMAETVRHLAAQIDEMLAGFLRGQTLVCLLLGVIYALGLSLVGLQGAIVVGMVAGLISFIPYVGSATGLIMAGALGVGQFGVDYTPLAMIAAVFVVGQFLEGNILTPRLVGDRVHLHPVWIMFALLAMGSLFGFLGLLLAVPSAAVIGVLVRYAVVIYERDYQHISDE